MFRRVRLKPTGIFVVSRFIFLPWPYSNVILYLNSTIWYYMYNYFHSNTQTQSSSHWQLHCHWNHQRLSTKKHQYFVAGTIQQFIAREGTRGGGGGGTSLLAPYNSLSQEKEPGGGGGGGGGRGGGKGGRGGRRGAISISNWWVSAKKT